METGGRLEFGVCAAVDVHHLGIGGARAVAVLAADVAFAQCWPNAPRSYLGYRRTGRASSTCVSSRRCARSWTALAGWACLVVDGYADLDPGSRPGLGAHAHAEFGIPVIGVAKTRFRTATHALPVLRGTSIRPLFVTAAGMPRTDAADQVRRMTGRYRLSDARRRADTLARAGPPGLQCQRVDRW